MTAAVISSLSPLKLNSTVLATEGLRIAPSVAHAAFRHSGNPYPSVMTVSGAQPAFSFRTPFYAAYSLIGVAAAPLKCTTVEVYLAKFADGVRAGTGTNLKLSLASSALGFAYITGASVEQNGILMADVTVALTSADGMTHPLALVTNADLPSLASQPALHSLGPISLDNGSTAIAGQMSVSMEMGPHPESLATDGDLYPRVFACYGYDRGFTFHHGDPRTLWGSTGLLGLNISTNVIQYFRNYDTTTGVKSATGLSLTIASGRIIPDTANADNLQLSGAGFRVVPLSSSSTDPFSFASGATIPTP